MNPEHTQITIRKQYLPRHRNFTGVIFGGDVLETLEKSALACVHRMQGGGDFRTIGMRGVSFLKPVDVRVAVEVQATIVSCTEHVVTVMVNSFLDEEHDGSRMVPSHRGVFHIARVVDNDDASLGKIVVGLKQLEGGGLENPDFYRCVAIGMSENLVKKWKLNSDAIVPEQKVLAESN